ncbi:MAG: hypothetical protein ABI181_05315 [Mycobacteriaceae bacterium]
MGTVLPPSPPVGPLPVVAHLRVYEPLAKIAEPERTELSRSLLGGMPGVPAALRAERLASLSTARRGGLPTDHATIGVLAPEDVIGGEHRVVGPGAVVCPWDTERRSAAALLGAAGRLPPLLAGAAGIDPAACSRARAVLARSGRSPVHVLSSAWSVPLAWFALLDPAAVQVLETDGLRRPVWRVVMGDVRVRGARALRTCSDHLGETSTVAVLADVLSWLSRFPDGCAVELDYGGLGALFDDAALAQDRSCALVNEVVGQLERGEGDRVRGTLAPVLALWGRVRSREHAS